MLELGVFVPVVVVLAAVQDEHIAVDEIENLQPGPLR